MIQSRRSRIGNALTYAAVIPLAAFFLIPVIWLVSLSVRTPQEVFLGASRLIPEAPTLANFGQVLTDGGFRLYLWNSVKLAFLGAAGAVAFAAPASYAFSRMTFRGKPALMMGILAVQMVSGLVILIPLYRYMDRLGLLETHFGTTLLYISAGIPVTVWLLKTSFDAVPMELEEAAAIDGLGRFETFLRITLPLAAPGVASALILNVILNWSQFLIPFVMLSESAKWPISVAIFNYAGATNATTTQLLAAACLVAVVPTLIVFLALQRLIVRALTSGALKG
ncbi:carbohydrate ABC transporter permease [Pseudoroseicyclus tamaricis]|uniref:Maltose/maltodextrin transport system permease protein MalG n=1 Tax=Pseudoroseicyclus tamaricis TaxID=2705421 RepID=A0A6B2JY45_9RHOB|nr:carbohydrate ABC transporter permease [Pseudoroseicyclus tamaricis]NDV01204.1 carbohydrate ABC transporter permease [Pseudoroseicyclus tamaricis]